MNENPPVHPAGPVRIVIAAGGTAGHVIPALAVADALKAEGARVGFIGGARAEAELVPAAGYELRQIPIEGLSRSNPLRALRALLRAGAACLRAFSLLGELRPDAVMGAGGYAGGPVGLAALVRRVPLVLTEADSHLGLTNRLLAPFARRICLAFPLPGREGPRYRVTGRPIVPPHADRTEARAALGIKPGETLLAIFGGSLGARSVNLAALDGLLAAQPAAELPGEGARPFAEGLRVIHVCGRRDFSELRGRALPAWYELREYMDPEPFAELLAAADLTLARAGGSVFELAANGLPAILIPYPHAAADHQSSNARWMAAGGAAVVIPDAELTGARLARALEDLLAEPERLRAMAAAARALARPEAAREVAGELLAAARVKAPVGGT